jgi:NADH:ubiquinone oxidoreductase subunit 4 (subunit M)
LFRLFLILFIQYIIYNIIYILSINFSIYICINIYLFNINIIFSYIFIWFLFFMLYIYYIVLYLLIKKYISNIKYKYIILIFNLILFFVIFIIILDDFICFIISFESLFFPICFISLFFNFNNRFIFAIYCLIIFSSISSILCLIIIIILLFYFNLININYFNELCFYDSLYLSIYIWILLFIIFGIKYPIWPLHIWLPELHVEVNTEMSIMLASLVLKIGFFGIFKFLFLSLNNISIWFLGFIDIIIILGINILSLQLLYLIDYKKIIAYWSIIHTGIGLILLWHNDILYISIIYLCNLAHILSSGFMFIIIGYMYDNYGLRIFIILMSFFGLNIWSSLFLLLFLFNIDFPFMLLMYVDIFVLYGLLSLSYIYIYIICIVLICMFLSSIYIYLCLSFFTFVWLDKYLRLDISINDCIIFILIGIFNLLLFFVLYIFI